MTERRSYHKERIIAQLRTLWQRVRARFIGTVSLQSLEAQTQAEEQPGSADRELSDISLETQSSPEDSRIEVERDTQPDPLPRAVNHPPEKTPDRFFVEVLLAKSAHRVPKEIAEYRRGQGVIYAFYDPPAEIPAAASEPEPLP